MNIKGIIPALITPFNEDFTVNYQSLRALVNRLIEDGADGFYVCGSTGECFLLSDEERMKVIETVVEEANGRVPAIAHVGNISQAKAVEYARHAQSVGASAVSSVPPFYYKFSFEGIAGFYGAISDAVDLPLIIYSVPVLSGVAVTADNISEIIKVSNVQGLKYTSYDLFELEKISRRYPQINLYNGHDEVYCNALSIGLAGAIGSTFNIMPKKYADIKAAYESGDVVRAAEVQQKINTIIEVLIKTGVTPGIKYLLTKSGIPCGGARPPFLLLNDEQKVLLDGIYDDVFQDDNVIHKASNY